MRWLIVLALAACVTSDLEELDPFWDLIPAWGNETNPLEFIGLEDQLDAFFSHIEDLGNTTSEGPWTVVAFVTLVPLRCDEIHRVAPLFDVAMRQANPDSRLQSVPRRLQGVECAKICPCADEPPRARVLQLESTSWTKTLAPPPAHIFPYSVRID